MREDYCVLPVPEKGAAVLRPYEEKEPVGKRRHERGHDPDRVGASCIVPYKDVRIRFQTADFAASNLGKRMTVSVPPKKFIIRVLQFLISALLLAYVGDSLWFRVRMIHPMATDPLESFTGPRVLAIQEKGNKISYEIDQQNPEQTVTCAHSWFPHAGYRPCWYVKPRLNQPIPM